MENQIDMKSSGLLTGNELTDAHRPLRGQGFTLWTQLTPLAVASSLPIPASLRELASPRGLKPGCLQGQTLLWATQECPQLEGAGGPAGGPGLQVGSSWGVWFCFPFDGGCDRRTYEI